MTLIAGFKCAGGVVLCADTLEEAVPVQYSVDKLTTYKRDWCRIGFAGSGDQGDLIDMVVERIQERLDRAKPDKVADIKKHIRAALMSVHRNELAAYPQPPPPADPIDTRVVLLMAVSPRKEPEAKLFLTNGTALKEVSHYEVRGIGEVVRFAAKRLYRKDRSLIETVLLCIHLLSLSKKNLTGVGGDSHILVLTDDGWIHQESVKETELIETYFEHFERDFADLFLAYADSSLDENQFDLRLQFFINRTQQLRKAFCEEFKKYHLGWAITDPAYAGDPYRKLPEGADAMLGYIRVEYSFFDHLKMQDSDFTVNPQNFNSQDSRPTGSFKGKLVAKKPGRQKRG